MDSAIHLWNNHGKRWRRARNSCESQTHLNIRCGYTGYFYRVNDPFTAGGAGKIKENKEKG